MLADSLDRLRASAFGNGASQAFTYDPVSRLSQLTNSLTDSNDLSATFAYDPASWIRSTTRTGDMYAWTGHFDENSATTTNGLNELATVGGVAATYDARGNLTSEPQSGKTYGYSSENLLTSASGGVTLAYDPAMRLYQTVGAATTRFAYDGGDAIAEYDGANTLQRRFVFDPTTGEPVLWYEGTGTAASNRRYLSTDERGSVISVSDSTGASLGINTYDEYGKPGASNIGLYQYTGQMWVPETGAYHFPNRDYVAQGGIFGQTDPAGYDSGANWYIYTGDDPINYVDPLGLCGEGTIAVGVRNSGRPNETPPPAPSSNNDIVVTGQRLCEKLQPVGGGVAQSPDPQAPIEVIGRRLHPTPPIVVTAPRPAVPLLIPAAAFNGLSFCPNARLGSSNFLAFVYIANTRVQ